MKFPEHARVRATDVVVSWCRLLASRDKERKRRIERNVVALKDVRGEEARVTYLQEGDIVIVRQVIVVGMLNDPFD